MKMLYTSLNNIRKFRPCEDGWKQLLTYLNKTKADDEKLDFKTILYAVGIKDTLWCLRTQEFKDYYKFTVRVSYSVLPIYENKYPNDNRPRLAIEAVEKFINGEISEEELEEARANAFAAFADAFSGARDGANAFAASAAGAWAAKDAWAAADAARAAADTARASVAHTRVFAAADATVDAAARYAAYHVADAAYHAAAKKEKWEEIEKIFIEECLN